MHYVEIDEYKAIVAEALHKVDMLCRENSLRYQVAYGTLLGAVRHKGFIPWDDDVDILMPLEDYYKLMDIINSGDYGINFIDIKSNPDTPFPYGKICATETFAYEVDLRPFKGYGAFIDVFPVVNMPDNSFIRHFRHWKIRVLSIITKESGKYRYNHNAGAFMRKVYAVGFFFSRFCNTRKGNIKFHRLMEKMNSKATQHMGIATSSTHYEFDYDIFKDMVDLDFEDFKVKGPHDWKRMLTYCYGPTYMTPPPEDKRASEHFIECYR